MPHRRVPRKRSAAPALLSLLDGSIDPARVSQLTWHRARLGGQARDDLDRIMALARKRLSQRRAKADAETLTDATSA